MSLLWEGFCLVFRALAKLKRIASLKVALRSGLTVGRGSKFIGDVEFGSEPYLISIGNNCLVTSGVKFVTHDGSIQVPLIKNGETIDQVYSKKSTFARVQIGNNVFIGMSSILLPGTKISDNSIVAAGSVVKGIYPDSALIAGNPAKVIGTVDDYYVRNKYRIVIFDEGRPRKEVILSKLDMLYGDKFV